MNELDDLAPDFIDFIDTIKQNATANVLNNEFQNGGVGGLWSWVTFHAG